MIDLAKPIINPPAQMHLLSFDDGSVLDRAVQPVSKRRKQPQARSQNGQQGFMDLHPKAPDGSGCGEGRNEAPIQATAPTMPAVVNEMVTVSNRPEPAGTEASDSPVISGTVTPATDPNIQLAGPDMAATPASEGNAQKEAAQLLDQAADEASAAPSGLAATEQTGEAVTYFTDKGSSPPPPADYLAIEPVQSLPALADLIGDMPASTPAVGTANSLVIATPDLSAGHGPRVVNDCKVDISSPTTVVPVRPETRGGVGGGTVLPVDSPGPGTFREGVRRSKLKGTAAHVDGVDGSSEQWRRVVRKEPSRDTPMIASDIRCRLKSAPETHRHSLRQLATLAEQGHDVLEMLAEGPEAFLSIYRNDGHSTNVGAKVAKIIRAAEYLTEANPELGWLVSAHRKAPNTLPRIEELPRALQADFGRYADILATEDLEPVSRAAAYRLSLTWFAAAVKGGVRLNHSFSVRTMIVPAIVQLVFSELAKDYSKKTCSGIEYAMVRMARAFVPEGDEDFEALTELVRNRHPGHETSTEYLLSLHRALGSGIGERLTSAPDLIFARAFDSALKPADRRVRAAAGVAVAFKIFDPGLSGQATAAFDLALSVVGQGHDRIYNRPDRRGGSSGDLVPMPSALCDILDRFLALEQKLDCANTLLFPGRDGMRRMAQPVMAFVHGELELAVGQRLLWQGVSDMFAFASLHQDPDNLLAGAEALNYKHARSLAMRMGPIEGVRDQS